MRTLPAWLALGAIATLIGGAALALVSVAPATSGVFDTWFWSVLSFTLWQAGLSTLLSVGLAVPVARALSRCSNFPGRKWLLTLFGLPLALPALVAVFGILAVYGGRGWLNGLGTAFGLPALPNIYGLDGILLAHTFFNLPLAIRLLLAALDRVPLEQWRLGQQLSFSGWTTFRNMEWPAIRADLPGVIGLVFMLCLTSFAVVLILGGGPSATTLDVAIYQALRFDFDPARAVVLATAQVLVTGIALVIIAKFGLQLNEEPTISAASPRPGERSVVDIFLIGAATLFVLLPLAALVLKGLGAEMGRLAQDKAVQRATLTSLAVAVPAALIAVSAALALVHGRLRGGGRLQNLLFSAAGNVTLVVSPVLLGAGWFVALNRFGYDWALAASLLIAANAALALPFAMRVVGPAVLSIAARTDRLSAQLGLSVSARLRLVWWPMLRRPLATAFAFTMALSLGDLGVIALIGNQDLVTLPALLMQRMGSYRTDDAAGIALILAIVAISIFTLGDRGKVRL
jgi:thiamine transport system permease protein